MHWTGHICWLFMLQLLPMWQCQLLACNGPSIRQKRIVLRNPTTRQLAELKSCQYNVSPWSAQVCQVRIDFERFELPQPQLNVSSQRLECLDFLQVQRFRLCGHNNGQHLYVPLQRGQLLQLVFSLGSQATQTIWQLTLTQLECPRENLISLTLEPTQAASPTVQPILPFLGNLLPRTFFMDAGNPGPGQQLLNTLTAAAPATADFEMLAPLGCDQYYRSKSGGIASFNYGNGIYLPNMKYAICVKSAANNEISYSIDHFALSKNLENVSGAGYDADCHSTVYTLGRATDYLLIPNSYMANHQAFQPTYYCGSGLAGNTLRSRPPFTIYFSSDGMTNVSETGFHLTYNVQQMQIQEQQMEL